jgi:hypothetical protein
MSQLSFSASVSSPPSSGGHAKNIRPMPGIEEQGYHPWFSHQD